MMTNATAHRTQLRWLIALVAIASMIAAITVTAEPADALGYERTTVKKIHNSQVYGTVSVVGRVTARIDSDEMWFADRTGRIRLDFQSGAPMPNKGRTITVFGSTAGSNEIDVDFWVYGVAPVPPPEVGPIIRCSGIEATVVGTNGRDVIRPPVSTSGPDVIAGLGGNDIIRAGRGADVLCGGPGNDRLYGNSGHDVLFGEGGRDTLNGGSGFDICIGGSARDRFHRSCEIRVQ